ncbi:hypothetical protein [Amycolatopsis nigrescens]|uniref:hypothetical protein n=1 Tax=Amycolatopsis nigrescens TaxID=381445 RepID=UPI0003A91405|nr:hypothetical protein [Amycolatopsis nigrescens]
MAEEPGAGGSGTAAPAPAPAAPAAPAASESRESAPAGSSGPEPAEKPSEKNGQAPEKPPEGEKSGGPGQQPHDGESAQQREPGNGEQGRSGADPAAGRPGQQTGQPDSGPREGEKKSGTADDFGPRVEQQAGRPDVDPAAMRSMSDELGSSAREGQQAGDEGAGAARAMAPDWTGEPGRQAGERGTSAADEARATGAEMRSLADRVAQGADVGEQTVAEWNGEIERNRPLFQMAGSMPDGEREVAEERVVSETARGANEAVERGAQAMRQIFSDKAEAGDGGKPENENTAARLVGDLLRSSGDVNLEIEKAVGETADDFVDGAASTVGDALKWAGLTDAGDAVTRGADNLTDSLAEETLAEGARSRNASYDLAQAIDGTDRPRTVYISHERHPESATHIDEAQRGAIWRGDTSRTVLPPPDRVLTVDRQGSESRRAAAIGGIPSSSEFDRDEYPPAVADTTGEKSVKYIPYSDNRGSGSSMGNQLNGRDASIQRQLDGRGMLGDFWGLGRADDGDKFEVRTFR